MELPEFRCGSPALASRGSRRKPEDLVVEGSPDDSPPATSRPPAHGTVRVHRFAAGRALALLHAAHSGSSPTRGKKAMSLDGAIPPEERASPEGWQGPLCPPSGTSFRVARRQRLGKMRHSSDDSESLSTRAGSRNHSPDEIETQAWPSHELEEKIRKPRSEVKLTLPIAIREPSSAEGTSSFQSFPCPVASWTEAKQEAKEEPTSWRAPGHVPIDCVIRRRKKRAKELRLALPFPVPKGDPRFGHLIETEGQTCQVPRSQSSFAWV